MKILLTFVLIVWSAISIAATKVDMGSYEIATTPEIAQLLEVESCARVSANAVKAKIDAEAANHGVDLPDVVDVDFLKAITMDFSGKSTYSITMNGESWLVLTRRQEQGCLAVDAYHAGTGGASVSNQ